MLGFTLGGGVGDLARQTGLAADSLVSATVVLSTGRIVVCNSTHNTELLWALRGSGGGQFGVVVSMEMALRRIDDTVRTRVPAARARVLRVTRVARAVDPCLPVQLAARQRGGRCGRAQPHVARRHWRLHECGRGPVAVGHRRAGYARERSRAPRCLAAGAGTCVLDDATCAALLEAITAVPAMTVLCDNRTTLAGMQASLDGNGAGMRACACVWGGGCVCARACAAMCGRVAMCGCVYV